MKNTNTQIFEALHITPDTSLKALKQFVHDHEIEVVGHKGKKQSYFDAIYQWRVSIDSISYSNTSSNTSAVSSPPVKSVKRHWKDFPENIVKSHKEYIQRYRLSKDSSTRCSSYPIGGVSFSRQKIQRSTKISRFSIFTRELKRLFAS